MSLINNTIGNPKLRIEMPVITESDFIDKLIIGLQKAGANEDSAYIQDWLFYNGMPIKNAHTIISNLVLEDYEPILDYNDSYMQYAKPDDLLSNKFNHILGIHRLNSGIPYWGIIQYGNESVFFRMIFYDGKNFQFFTPCGGNAINQNTGAPLLSEEYDDPDEDESYLNNYGVDYHQFKSASIEDKLDGNIILQELETIFSASLTGLPSTPISKQQTGNSHYGNNSTCSQKTKMDILYEVLSQKQLQLLSGLITSTKQIIQTYDKKQCFKDLKNKDIFEKDILNFIAQINLQDTPANICIECNKIATFIKKYQYLHEGKML